MILCAVSGAFFEIGRGKGEEGAGTEGEGMGGEIQVDLHELVLVFFEN